MGAGWSIIWKSLLGIDVDCLVIGTEICEKLKKLGDDIEEFFKKYGWLILLIGATGAFLFAVGFFGGYVEEDFKFLTDFLKTLAIPFEEIWKFIGYLWGYLQEFNQWISGITKTLPELWNLAEIVALGVSVIEFFKDTLSRLLDVDSAGYPAKIYVIFSSFVEILSKGFDELGLSSWNPLTIVAKFFFILLDLIFLIITPFVNLLNPFQWYEWLKKLYDNLQ